MAETERFPLEVLASCLVRIEDGKPLVPNEVAQLPTWWARLVANLPDRLRALAAPRTPSEDAVASWMCDYCGQFHDVGDAARQRAGEDVCLGMDTWWLIERGSAENQSPPVWWCGGDEWWTEEAARAIRYRTKAHAEAVVAYKSLPARPWTVRVTSHVFLPVPRVPSPLAGGEEQHYFDDDAIHRLLEDARPNIKARPRDLQIFRAAVAREVETHRCNEFCRAGSGTPTPSSEERA